MRDDRIRTIRQALSVSDVVRRRPRPLPPSSPPRCTATRRCGRGDPDLPFTATFIGDFGRALADVGQHADVAGQVFHIQAAPEITGWQFIETIGRIAGSSPKFGRLTPRLVGVLKIIASIAREGAELLYQFDRAFLVDDSRLRELTGRGATAWEDGIRQTLDCYGADPERSRYRLLPGKSR